MPNPRNKRPHNQNPLKADEPANKRLRAQHHLSTPSTPSTSQTEGTEGVHHDASDMETTESADERALVQKRSTWRSSVYEHFHPAEIVRNSKGEKLYKNGILLYSFICKRTGSSRVRKANDASTGNLRKHIATCVPPLNQSQIIENFATGCTEDGVHHDASDTEATESADERALVQKRSTWRSSVYEHFHPAEIARNSKGEKLYTNGILLYSFICKRTGSSRVRKANDASTGNLRKHIATCVPPLNQSQTIENFATGCTYSPEGFRWQLMRWVVHNNRAYTIIDDEELREIFTMLHGNANLPSAITLASDIKLAHGLMRAKLINLFEEHSGKVHLSLDPWTSRKASSYLGLVVQWCPDEADTIVNVMLDLLRVPKPHTGAHFAKEVYAVLKDFGIALKLLGLAGDNASNNQTMTARLARHFPTWGGGVRCIAHTVNVAEQAFLAPFRAPRHQKHKAMDAGTADNVVKKKDFKAEDTEAAEKVNGRLEELHEDDDEEDQAAEDDIDPQGAWEQAAEVEEMERRTTASLGCMNDRECQDAMLMLSKVTGLAKRVARSDQLRKAFEEYCEHASLKPLALRRPVATRWNTYCQCLGRELEQRAAVVRLCENALYSRHDLEKYALASHEWDILEQMQPVLQMFEKVTQYISQSGSVLVHQVFPIIDRISTELERVVDNEDVHMSIRHGAKNALRVIDKYYPLSNDSEIYRVAMILHPKYKIEYFRAKGWSAEWIENALTFTRRIWNEQYKVNKPGAANKDIVQAPTDDFDDFEPASPVDAFERYLAEPAERHCTTPLTFWHTRQEFGLVPKSLARMAKDFLSCPATSVDVERVFSFSSQTINPLRTSLTDKSVRTSVVLNSWMTILALDVETTFKDKLVEAWGQW